MRRSEDAEFELVAAEADHNRITFEEAQALLQAPRAVEKISAERARAGDEAERYRRSDDRIRDDVCDALSIDPLVDASEVEVEVSGGKVVLQGRVENRHLKRRVEDLAFAAFGVVDVENNLRAQSQ